MCKTQGWEYLTVRRPQSEWARIQALEAAGFHTVDGILELSRKIDVLSSSGSGVTSPYRFRLAEKTDADAVAALSAKSFHLSRFHNDPLITRAQADRVHFEWGRNSCLGLAADGVWLVEREGILCGFITGKIKDKTGSIVLITVDPQEAGRGVGLALVQKACAWFSERGCLEARVPTQTNNFAALRLYTRAGFETVAASVTLRWSATK